MEQSFPFNSVNHDRRYKAEDFATYFKPFLANGVFAAPSTNLQVTAGGTDMKIAVQPGDAWINGYGYHNDAPKYIQLTNADGAANRIDRLVLRWSRAGRNITAVVKQGEYATTPVAPDVQRDADIYELALADVLVSAGVTSISQAVITDLRPDDTVCGWVDSLIHVDSATLYEQFRQQFNDWFAHIQSSLGANQVGNLQNQIDNKAVQTYVHSKSGTVHNLAGLGPEGKFLATADYDIDDTFTVNDVSTPAMLADGSYLPDKLFRAGNWVHFTFDGTKINFNEAGGAVSLNLFCQPDEPKMKDGLWIKSPEKNDVRRIINRKSYAINGKWRVNEGWPGLTLPKAERADVTLSYGGKLYLLTDTGQTCYYLYIFDIATKTWIKRTTSSYSVTQPVLMYHTTDGLIAIVFTGYSGGNGTTYFYNPVTDAFTTKTTSNASLNGTSKSTIGQDGNIGYIESTYTTYPHGTYDPYTVYWYSYDISTDTYQQITSKDAPGINNDSGRLQSYIYSVYFNGKIYAIICTSGYMYSNSYSNYVLNVYDIESKTWTDLGHIQTPVTTFPTTYLGKIYTNINGSNAMQVYDTATSTWSQTPAANKPWTYLFAAEDKIIALGTDFSVYDFKSEVLPKDTLALISGRENLITLVSTRGIDSLNSSFSDVWWYDTNFREWPTYTGDGKQWNKIKN